jgi:hypothetical protein
MRIKKRVTETVRKQVAALLVNDRELSATELKSKTEKVLKGKKYQFTVRTYSNIKKNILPNIDPNEAIDQEWTIGDCEENHIPDSMIPRLMQNAKVIYRARKWGEPYDHLSDKEYDAYMAAHNVDYPEEFMGIPISLTVRQARWMSRLNSLVDKLIEKYKNDKIDPELTGRGKYTLLWLLYDVAETYADSEKINEALGNKHFNTDELDEILFKKDYPTYNNFFWAMHEISWKQILAEDIRANRGYKEKIKEYIDTVVIPNQNRVPKIAKKKRPAIDRNQ